jgi:hypothetical protein
MPGKTPRNNGKQPLENGSTRSNKESDSNSKGKKVASKDGDEEMTVVVPPKKNDKPSGAAPADADGDVAMEGDEQKADEAEVKVDPATQAIAGESIVLPGLHPDVVTLHLGGCMMNVFPDLGIPCSQISRVISRCLIAPSLFSTPDSPSERSDPFPSFANT